MKARITPRTIPRQTESGRLVQKYLDGRILALWRRLCAAARKAGGLPEELTVASAGEAALLCKWKRRIGLPEELKFSSPRAGRRSGHLALRRASGRPALPSNNSLGKEFLDALRARLALREEGEALRAARLDTHRLSLAMQAAGLAFWDWNIATGEALFSMAYDDSQGCRPVTRVIKAGEASALVHPDDRHVPEEELARIWRTGDDSYRTVVRQWPRQNDAYVYIESRGRVVERDRTGAPARLVGVYSIVTDRVEADRASALRDEQLAMALRMSSASEVAARMAHELNQPLAALSTYSQAARRFLTGRRNRKEVLDAIDKCVELARRAADIVQAVRRSIRAEADVRPVAFRKTVESAIETLRHFGERRNVRIFFTADCRDCTVMGDPVQLGQLVLNLISNAIENSPQPADSEPAAVVGIRLAKRGGEVTLTIENRIPEEKRLRDWNRCFESFFTTKPGGLGLGLPICRSISEAHGGRLIILPLRDQAVCARFSMRHEK